MITKHASNRMRQRSIPPLVVTWLEQYGKTRHDHHGAIVCYFDKQSRRDLEREVGRPVVSRLSPYLDCYAVLDASDRRVVTVGHRFRRLNMG
jgi:hypothetical protein